jgi:Tfp pilus assembly protein PilN
MRFWRSRLVVIVGRDVVHAFDARRAAAVALGSRAICDADIEAAFAAVASRAAADRRGPRRVIALLSPAYVNVRLGETRGSVRAGAEDDSSLFAWPPEPLLARGAPTPGGLAAVGAFDQAVVPQLARAASVQGLSLEAVAPLALLMSGEGSDSQLSLRDGDLSADVSWSGTAMTSYSLRRSTAAESSASPAEPEHVIELSKLGADVGARVARRAVRISDWVPTLRPTEQSRRLRSDRLRRVSAGAALLLAALGWLLAPAVMHARLTADSERRLAALAGAVAELSEVQRSLAIESARIAAVRSFAESGIHLPDFLSAMSEAFPEGSYIETMSLAGGRGRITAVAPSATALLASLQGVPDLMDVSTGGALAQETIDGRRFERIVVEFRLRPTGVEGR